MHWKMAENPTKTRKKLLKQRKTPCFLNKNTVLIWQGHKDLNPEPTVLETAALPIELYPYISFRRRPVKNWWAFRDSNPGLSGYEPEALTN